ncbi:tumor necrosis factor receptor superfamily member 1B-like [Amia ocellicauda]|uniref:tumor necrosis factor receptor superfamily member 1B-like n=1 Tax=Amia ocellicauda TaxID=2972642 RepID=UPI003464D664
MAIVMNKQVGTVLPVVLLLFFNKPERNLAFQTEDQIKEGGSPPCRKCLPGQRVLRACTVDSDTQCVVCEEETYMDYPTDLKKCLACRKPCGLHEQETAPCTRTQSRQCRCLGNAFELDGECVPHRTCGPGYGVYKPGTSLSNVLCKRCLPNHFSDAHSSTAPCRKHTDCRAKKLSTVAFGNTTSDHVCGPRTQTTPVIPKGNTEENKSIAEPSLCLTKKDVALAVSLLLGLLVCCVTGWSLYIRKRKKLNKHVDDLSLVDKNWKFVSKETGAKRNALHVAAEMIGKDWPRLLGELGYTKDWRSIREENKHVYDQALEGLRLWTNWEDESSLSLLKQATKAIGRNDIYEVLDTLTEKQCEQASDGSFVL